MIFQLNLHQILYILELCGTLNCTWPQNRKSNGFKLFLDKIGWIIAMTNLILVLIPLALAVYYHRHDSILQMKAISEFTALVEVFFDLIFCKMEGSRLYKLTRDIRAFLDIAENREKIIIQHYANRYSTFFTIIGLSYFFSAITFSLGPLFLPQELPGDAWLPFSTESLRIRSVIYAMQVCSILQTACSITVDFTIAILFYYPAARLDMLEADLQNVQSVDQLKLFVKKHQEIIRFVEETQCTVEKLLFKTNATMGFSVMCGALPLIYNPAPVVLSQFISLLLAACGRLYVICWPADDLRESSQRVSFSAYSTQWVGSTPEIMSDILIIMQRSQKPLLISMGGLLPPPSLEYYASFLTTVSSYFMTIRAVIDD